MTMIINNMFSIFDPSSAYYSSSWIIISFVLVIINNSQFNTQSNIHIIYSSLILGVNNEINQLVTNNVNLTESMLIIIFFTILIINVLAIFPFNFTCSAHISVSMSLSTTIWISAIIFGWVNQFNSIIVHLTPLGTPNPLINFIVLIETISNMIRPVTLSIRLSANIVAGHLLISLLSSFSMSSISYTIYSLAPITLLIFLEIGVAIVQAYVLITLLALYQNETT